MKINEIMAICVDTPWKLANEIKRILYFPINYFWFSLNHIVISQNWKIYGIPRLEIYRHSIVKIGKNLELRCFASSNPLTPNHPTVISTRNKNSSLLIGENFSMTGGSLVAEKSIQIGNNVTVGANTIIVDTDFHPIDPAVRKISPNRGKIKPVTIEDDVFIGANCIILKGVTIGQSAVIGAGSVVSQDIPSHLIYAGNPARQIKI